MGSRLQLCSKCFGLHSEFPFKKEEKANKVVLRGNLVSAHSGLGQGRGSS
jgi:hypothetical protein